MKKNKPDVFNIEAKYNEKLKQETLARWQEVEDGKVVSHQTVIKWLNTWGKKESDRPSHD